ncbi:MAG: TetR/AcrR family transcriptional regulator [Spirochaetales bacterium]|nr:TetR/AcrR family transcriptional regulator [Spirochaetales bacterium]
MNRDQRVIEIYGAALEEFAEFGFARSNITQIAEKLNMTKGNLYFFIKSKKELYRDSIAWGLMKWQTRVFEKVMTIESPVEKFTVLCESSYYYLAENPVLRSILIRDQTLFPIDPQNGGLFSEIHDGSIRMISNILEEGKLDGLFREDLDVEHISQLTYSIYVMFIVKTYILSNKHSFEAYFSDAVDLILHGVLKTCS